MPLELEDEEFFEEQLDHDEQDDCKCGHPFCDHDGMTGQCLQDECNCESFIHEGDE